MSARKFHLDFSTPAQKDVDNILAYTLEQWGERQLVKYKSALDKAFKAIAADPAIGRRETEHLRSFRAEHHRIFYRIEKHTLYVIRILHERMDCARHL